MEILSIEHNSSEWYELRKSGIGGSDAAAILGLSPWKTNVDLWEEKVGIKSLPDLKDNKAVKYGREAEDSLIKMFTLDFPEYTLRTNKSVVYRRGFMFASLDAEIVDSESSKGFLECKTAEPHSALAHQKWNNGVPDYYYTQILHYLIVTGWDFAILKAQIKSTGQNGLPRLTTEHYYFKRDELNEEMKYLYIKEREFWSYVERKERPPLILPDLRK